MKIFLLALSIFAFSNDSGSTQSFLAREVVAGGDQSCAISIKNEAKCWGNNFYGQLGLEDTNYRGYSPNQMGDNLKAIELGEGFNLRQIVLGEGHTCALSVTNQIKCWGENDQGQLGIGDRKNRGDDVGEMGDNLKPIDLGSDFTPKFLASGRAHTCALSTKGKVKCWGINLEAQLGIGDKKSRGDDAGEMGDKLPLVNLGNDFVPEILAAGSSHTCALSTKNQIKCWGGNFYGQLGYGDQNNRGDQPEDMGDNLKPIALGKDFIPIKITVGSYHSCALSTKNQIKCWGWNGNGQLGLGDKNVRGDGPNEMGDNLVSVDLGKDFIPQTIAAGYRHTCALSTKQQVKCWGWNTFGQLGQGDEEDRGDEAAEMGENLPPLPLTNYPVSLSLGLDHNCAIGINRTITCWGSNSSGQLGLGDDEDRGDEPGELDHFVDL